MESYGRKEHIDAHCGSTRLVKGQTPASSIPPSYGLRYNRVWPISISSTTDGARLVIGTHSFNALVTSSIRIDRKESPSLGGMTVSFMVPNKRISRRTSIFLNTESIRKSYYALEKKVTYYDFDSNKLERFRQLRSKFSEISTYFQCRVPGDITRSWTMMSYTIFTLVGHESLKKGNGRAAAILFNKIGTDVLSALESETKPILPFAHVKESFDLCSIKNDISETLKNVMELFKDQETIPIFENKELSTKLGKLAHALGPYVQFANEHAAKYILDYFVVYC
jgi:hypothetical protein